MPRRSPPEPSPPRTTPSPSSAAVACPRGHPRPSADLPVNPFTRWSEISNGSGGAAAYQERFDTLERDGIDVHGEARLVARHVSPPARVLDAGCGTGRVATELTRLGFHCVGVDADLAMIEVARTRDHETTYVHQDLGRLYLRSGAFDLVVLAGNVVPLLGPGTLAGTMRRVAEHTVVGGLVVAGFGLDPAHLPDGCPVTPLADYERACFAAGLAPVQRWSTWDEDGWAADATYVVSAHRRL